MRPAYAARRTPQFMAANPATVMNKVSGPLGKGTRVLRDEEQLGFDLVNSLSGDALTAAVIAEEAPAEIRFAGAVQANGHKGNLWCSRLAMRVGQVTAFRLNLFRHRC